MCTLAVRTEKFAITIIMNHNVYYKNKLFNLRNNIRSLYHFTHIIV